MTDGASIAADATRQLRLALSMNGGVSLAVWIGGAVSEIDCLRCGAGFWGDLLEGCGFQREALVDVMTGASAGGLNAVLMAQSIRSATPFSKFLGLWQDQADIDLLLKGPLHAVAAAATAAMLFFWMRWWAGGLLTALTAALYLQFAHAAYRAQIGRPLDDWPRWWMFHSLWVCWLIAVLGIPLLLGFMNDNMLRPHPTKLDGGGDASG